MATAPEPDFFDEALSCLPCLNDDGDDAGPSSFQGTIRNHNLRHAEMKETEDLLAAEMNKFSVQERSRALEDVHCVAEELQETPAMIEQALREFDQVIQTTSNRLYTIAWNQNRSYVEDPSFRLKFLRANMFDVRKSVDHIMSFLSQKALYFGEEKVAQDITVEDMNEEEIAVMRSGFFQILKDRDQSGRAILYNSSVLTRRISAEIKVEPLIRAMYHILFNMLIPMPSVQTKGIVVVYYDEWTADRENWKLPSLSVRMKGQHILNALPLRLSSLHICLHSSPGNLALHNKLVQSSLRAFSQLTVIRTRLHYGSDLERQYHLRAFGIPLDNFPVDKNGTIRTEMQTDWCDEYLQNATSAMDQHATRKDSRAIPNAGTICLLETDVMLGRGKSGLHHPGNVRFREFLEAHAEEYEQMPRHQRKRACMDYTRELISSGTRFLRQTDAGLWAVCGFDEAVDKVAQFFRTLRRSRRL